MTQNLLEILLFLAYLCVALISVLIAIYAIAISYLGRETYRSVWSKKKRRENLEKKLKELGEKADIDGIIEEIGSYEKEISEIDEKLFYLSVKGAVIVPSVFSGCTRCYYLHYSSRPCGKYRISLGAGIHDT